MSIRTHSSKKFIISYSNRGKNICDEIIGALLYHTALWRVISRVLCAFKEAKKRRNFATKNVFLISTTQRWRVHAVDARRDRRRRTIKFLLRQNFYIKK